MLAKVNLRIKVQICSVSSTTETSHHPKDKLHVSIYDVLGSWLSAMSLEQ
jgi:hypothetical protein